MKSMRNVLLISLLFAGGCIVGDELSTLTIQPDGSAELLIFRSNLHSTERGRKGEQELADYRANFKTQIEDEFSRLSDAGGKVTEVVWVREQVPFANIVRVRFADSSTLEKFGTVQTDDDSVRFATKFYSEGVHRKVTVSVAISPGKNDIIGPAEQGVERLRESMADGISETRIAVASGTITGSRGFVVASDKQSALLNVAQITETLRSEDGKGEFFLEWDVTQ